jgi:hypothetical protein
MLLSLLSKNNIPTAGVAVRRIHTIMETDRCNVPLYAIPSEGTEITFFLKQVSYSLFSTRLFGYLDLRKMN